MPPTKPRDFLRVAENRLIEARYLFEGKHYTVAIYLAGYTVECALKALLLASAPKSRRPSVGDLLRGNAGHNFDLLKGHYFRNGGADFPPEISKAFVFVNTSWRTRLRYETKVMARGEADQFLRSAGAILDFSKGRL